MKRQGLTRAERLRGKNNIDALFAGSPSLLCYPLRVVFRERPVEPGEAPCSFFVSVPKRIFKRAVRRNRIRRRIREAYRLNKEPFVERLSGQGLHLDVAFLFIGKEESAYGDLERAVQILLRRMAERSGPSCSDVKPA